MRASGNSLKIVRSVRSYDIRPLFSQPATRLAIQLTCAERSSRTHFQFDDSRRRRSRSSSEKGREELGRRDNPSTAAALTNTLSLSLSLLVLLNSPAIVLLRGDGRRRRRRKLIPVVGRYVWRDQRRRILAAAAAAGRSHAERVSRSVGRSGERRDRRKEKMDCGKAYVRGYSDSSQLLIALAKGWVFCLEDT